MYIYRTQFVPVLMIREEKCVVFFLFSCRQNSSYQDDVDPSLPPGSQYRESDQYPSDVDVVQYPPYHPEGYPNERQSDRISDPYANYPTEMFREQQQANYVQEEVSDEEEDEYEDDSVRKHRLPTSL